MGGGGADVMANAGAALLAAFCPRRTRLGMVRLRVWGALYKAWNWVSFVFVGFCFGFTVEFLLVVLLKVWWGDVGA